MLVWNFSISGQLPRRLVAAYEKRSLQALWVQSNSLHLHPPNHTLHHRLKPLPIQRMPRRHAQLCALASVEQAQRSVTVARLSRLAARPNLGLGQQLRDSIEPDVRRSFGWPMRFFLCLPLVTAVGAWLTQFAFRFPQGSIGASATAGVLVLGLLGGIVPVPIALIKLVRNPSARTLVNAELTAIAAAVLALGMLVVFALFAGR
jgi:hypothetical protein